MWPQQQGQGYAGQGNYNGQGGFVNQGDFVAPGYGHRNSSRGPYERGHGSAATLPKPRELRKRLDEARTTAGVLADVVNTSTPAVLLKHDLADDLSARCRRATNQVLEYMNTRDPTPDNHEMAALLATHEVLEQTLHHYHRAVLEARKSLGVGESRRTSDGNVAAEMTPAGKGKANAPLSPATAGPSGTNGGGSDSNGYSNGPESPRSGDEAFDRNEDDDMIAAAIAASTAPGANARGGHGGYQQGEGSSAAGGPANEAENPFADNLPESSRSSSRVRPVYGGGGGGGSSSAAAGGSSSAAGAAGGSGSGGVAYVDSDNESDEEYLRIRRRNKAIADVGSSSSSATAGGSRGPRASESAGGSSSAAAGASSSSSAAPPVPPASSKPGPASPRISAPGSPTGFDAGVGGSSSSAGPAVDSEAGGSGGPVFRY